MWMRFGKIEEYENIEMDIYEMNKEILQAFTWLNEEATYKVHIMRPSTLEQTLNVLSNCVWIL